MSGLVDANLKVHNYKLVEEVGLSELFEQFVKHVDIIIFVIHLEFKQLNGFHLDLDYQNLCLDQQVDVKVHQLDQIYEQNHIQYHKNNP